MMSLTKGMTRVDIVFGKYFEHSIKNLERSKWSHTGQFIVENIQSGHPNQTMERMVGNYENKK